MRPPTPPAQNPACWLLHGRAPLPLALGLPLVLMAVAASLPWWPAFQAAPDALAAAVVVDLTLTAPLAYLVLIRRRALPKLSALPLALLGLGLAALVLPAGRRQAVAFAVDWVLPAVELGVLGWVGVKLARLLRRARARRGGALDAFAALRSVAEEALGRRLGGLLAAELGALYHGLWGGPKPKAAPNAFCYHRGGSTGAVLWALVALLAVETGLLHLFLVSWNETIAWVVLALSAYGGVQLLAVARAASRRPHVLAGGALHARFSVLREAEVPLSAIESIEFGAPAPGDEALPLNPLGLLAEHNLVLRLNRPVTVRGAYGAQKACRALALFADEPARLARALRGGDAA